MKPLSTEPHVLRLQDMDPALLGRVLAAYGLQLEQATPGQDIPGSFWGDEEAGLIDNRLYVRPDTPVHSALHEACHYICMSADRRNGLHTDAGGDYDEENAVCYLQILLADALPEVGRERLMQDMDSWGYSFRLGRTRKWFEQDAEDAREFLINQRLLTEDGEPTFVLRS